MRNSERKVWMKEGEKGDVATAHAFYFSFQSGETGAPGQLSSPRKGFLVWS